LVERFAAGVQLLKSTCPGLVERIELGDLDGPRTRQILEVALRPMLERKIDTVVLACTHYPFVIPLIQDIVGKSVRVIDPAPAIAKQTQRLLDGEGLRQGGTKGGNMVFFTSADAGLLEPLLPKLLGETGAVTSLNWINDSELVRP
jgi:glutamate racemase